MIPIQISLAKTVTKEGAWFYEMDQAGQEAYVKKYPTSKYAVAYKAKKSEKGKDTVAKVQVSHHIKKHWHKFSEDQKEFFGRGGHKPESKERRTFGSMIKDNSKGIVKAIKHEVKEWQDAGRGIKKLATGKKMTSHEKHALKTVAIHEAMVIGPMAISGGLSAGLASAAKGIGLGLAEHTALIHGAKIAAFASAAPVENEITSDMSEEDALDIFVKQTGDAMISAKMPDRVWAEAALSNKK